jgi:uncharacterized membrane protein
MPVYTFTTFDDPSASSYTRAYGINDMGQIVGTYIMGLTGLPCTASS